jgi:hypothetical protein
MVFSIFTNLAEISRYQTTSLHLELYKWILIFQFMDEFYLHILLTLAITRMETGRGGDKQLALSKEILV